MLFFTWTGSLLFLNRLKNGTKLLIKIDILIFFYQRRLNVLLRVFAEAFTRYAALKTAEQNFVTAYHNKIDEASRKIYSTVVACVKEIKYRIETVLHYIDSEAHDHGGMYVELAGKINEIIDDTLTPAKAAETKKANLTTPPDEQSDK